MRITKLDVFRTLYRKSLHTHTKKVRPQPHYHRTHTSADTVWNPIHTNSLWLYKVLWSCANVIQSNYCTHTYNQSGYTVSFEEQKQAHRCPPPPPHTNRGSVSVCAIIKTMVYGAEIHMETPGGESLPGPVAMTLLLQFVDTDTHTSTEPTYQCRHW